MTDIYRYICYDSSYYSSYYYIVAFIYIMYIFLLFYLLLLYCCIIENVDSGSYCSSNYQRSYFNAE